MKKIAAALALVAGIGVASAGSTEAGIDADFEVRYMFDDFPNTSNALTAANGAVGELYQEIAPGSFEDITADKCTQTTPTGDANYASFALQCDDLSPGVHAVGIDQTGDYFVTDVFCGNQEFQEPEERIDSADATFTQPEFGYAWCDVYLTPKPILYIDKIADELGELGASDFPLEVYSTEGEVFTGTDPSDELCEFQNIILKRPADGTEARIADDSLCAAIPLLPGEYTMGEILPEYGYEPGSFECETEPSRYDFFDQPDEKLEPAEDYSFVHGDGGLIGNEIPFFPATLCRLTNDYVEVDVTADLVVVNDDGGTATADQFTIEVFDSSGVKVDEGVDPDPALGNDLVDFVLPVGDYTFGVSGPDGYTSSAVVNVTPVEETEIIPTGADFTAASDQDVAGVITVDDPPAEPAPTTLPPTTVPPTTLAPTTVPPTTLAPAPAPPSPPTTITMILPETGGGSNQTGTIVLMALGALLLGGGAVLATRRS